ncbi:uncharacterized protein Z518_00175 [Rhinocladiella mackenziei CBS 650.93]|uniref:Uncharacterized protein n=1 Tax=Rhinocladiella mackenziei CBS 650.93 TaxID=1442369 RepID=A0A0D2G3F9_9EURO|nr:uncharacterized protein Z518_00175 [Rhinocladiella mackenziei CBS 650.93]KIX09097.1 hypothetical protein Z518_00175 [Rhinocladiella mackenziei CBS 650.93]
MGMFDLRAVRETWTMFTPTEKRNIAIYIAGIMLYKFGLEAFNGSICVGSILIAPLIRRWPTKLVLAIAIMVFGIMTAILLIVDAGTGGRFKPDNWEDTHDEDDFGYYGSYNTDGIIPIYCVSGIVYGMVELIRRVIPRDIVGGNVQKLRRMDSLVHIFYEVSGTGAFGNNYSFPGYSIALYGHRYLENGIAPAVARRYLGNSAWSQIMVGGSNFGELLGAGFVFLFTNLVQTPMPWLRLDALMLLIVWYLPYWHPPEGDVNYAWRVAGTFIPISFGWAAGDVSLAAYIQASLARLEAENKDVSALGAVMAFLHSTYIVIYAICSPLLGRYIDRVYADTGGSDNGGDIHRAIRNVGGVQFTIIMAVVLSATFVPRGALSINPKMLNDEVLDKDIDHSADDGFANEKERRASLVQKKVEEKIAERRESVTRVSADINDTFSPDMKNIREEDGGLLKPYGCEMRRNVVWSTSKWGRF